MRFVLCYIIYRKGVCKHSHVEKHQTALIVYLLASIKTAIECIVSSHGGLLCTVMHIHIAP
jgi:hypothetical protein